MFFYPFHLALSISYNTEQHDFLFIPLKILAIVQIRTKVAKERKMLIRKKDKKFDIISFPCKNIMYILLTSLHLYILFTCNISYHLLINIEIYSSYI